MGETGEYPPSKERARKMPTDLKEVVILGGPQAWHVESGRALAWLTSSHVAMEKSLTPLPSRHQVSSSVHRAYDKVSCPP